MRIQLKMRPIVTDRVAWYVSRSVCLSVTIVSPAKTTEPIEMLFEMALLPPRKWTQAPLHFSAHVYCGETVAHLSNSCDLVSFVIH